MAAKIKWNWGTGIFIAIVAFILTMLIFMYFMFQHDFDLVEKDYYPKALEYQNQINKTNNALHLSEKVNIELRDDKILLAFPVQFNSDEIKGKIYFYRPSSKMGDVTIDIESDSSGTMIYSVKNLMPGKYLVKIDYSVIDRGYYQEESIFIQ